MADTAHSDPEQMKERFDSPAALEVKICALAELIKKSQHLVVFTGAGISTSAGIPDFRGPDGKWTREAKGLKPKRGVSTISAYPTKTHMALVELARRKKLKWLISQNCDGLHVRSGFPQERISELHGNVNMEICEICGQRYFRDLQCRRRNRGRDHFTGRFCVRDGCKGRLLESTIDFGQCLPETPLANAEYHSEKADLHIALGSSLTVTPAADCPKTTSKKGHLVIVNLQKTPLTKIARHHIHAKTDEVMERVMQKLGYEIPPFRLLRKLIVGCDPSIPAVYCRGADVDDPTLEMDFIRGIKWSRPILGMQTDFAFYDHSNQQQLQTEVPINNLTKEIDPVENNELGDNMRVFMKAEIQFAGYYQERNLQIACDFTEAFRSNRRVEYLWSLEYNPYVHEWKAVCEVSSVGRSECKIDPSYGKSHANYVIDGVVKYKKISRSEATNLFKQHVKQTSKR